MLLFYSERFFDPIRRFWDRAFFGKYFPNKAYYLENSESDQKHVLNKKDAEFNSASFLFKIFFDPIRRFWDRAFFGKYFPKKALYLENGELDQKCSEWKRRKL